MYIGMDGTQVATKAVLIKFKQDFLTHLDKSFPRCGYSERSQFIRDAVAEKLERERKPAPENAELPPSRLGKGGARAREGVDYSVVDQDPMILNDHLKKEVGP